MTKILLTLIIILPSPLLAEETEGPPPLPMMGEGPWVKFEEYKQPEEVSANAQDDEQLFEAVGKAAPPPQTLAVPDRPLVLPSVPTRVPSYNVKGASKDETAAKDLRGSEVPREGWTKADKVDEFMRKSKAPIPIRYSALPDHKVQPMPAERISKPKTETQILTAGPAPKQTPVPPKAKVAEKPKTEVSQEACDALTELRKKQIKAIESDRQTLSALRTALKDMGLTKDLEFMANPTLEGGPLVDLTQTSESAKAPAQGGGAQASAKTP